MNEIPIQCLTQDGIEMSHEAQVLALCAAGAQWIQLRFKEATDDAVAMVADACLPVCRARGVRLIVDDRIHVALSVGADGVHLGKLDMPWHEARALAGQDFIIGGTVNSVADALRASEPGLLDYVGVGPYRFTETKKNLAPILSGGEWQEILRTLGPIPSYAIGGICVEDLPELRERGVTGVAVCSGVYRHAEVTDNYRAFLDAWESEAVGV
ncbi:MULTISPECIES: thiamine phosphate synthase [unclassified Lentimonas]|uniref:thiamine phosphate synthase n=1 Tax=unclassified Lentimonas TaxID=2630993 RepID=UPI001323F283|nr:MULTISPECIES: thiamine phosphate synthase [unclassified Lentimonas]CAA6680092.1 Thiamin-phosphate pyrophosphorylase (EC [Lentimonas sp. CC4]CAA6685072.1 Thiamin-phosphate pyrophosphorylase (EC [Lentimonas sp. CC6]CAA6691435.1 Thiamin-phosphate pyrophosphorylase (EC [Lentimonas sp. CC10]CAA6693173.1 Thiamin-phosphate pyrophosphorylase (EC [Lentimonas sp. CC19]CAA7068945.1 Thiamin-phosphate pyrophosphorylase (EC [Lentimonas sp. CC11]